MMDHLQFQRMIFAEDKSLLEELQRVGMVYVFLGILEDDPFERYYYRRLSKTADEQISLQESRMVRKYL